MRIALLGFLCEIHAWGTRDDLSAIAPDADAVLRLAPPGSTPWIRAACVKLIATTHLGQPEEFMATVHALLSAEPAPEASTLMAFTWSGAASLLTLMGEIDLAEVILERLSALGTLVPGNDPLASGWVSVAHARREAAVNEDPWAGLQWAERARASFLSAHHQRGSLLAQLLIGMNLWCLGAFARADRELRAIPAADDELGLFSSMRRFCLVWVLAQQGALAEARAESTFLIGAGRAQRTALAEGRGRWAAAEVLRLLGETGSAEREAREATVLLAQAPLEQIGAMATLAAVLLAAGRAPEALAAAEDAIARYQDIRACGFCAAQPCASSMRRRSPPLVERTGPSRRSARPERACTPSPRRSAIRSSAGASSRMCRRMPRTFALAKAWAV